MLLHFHRTNGQNGAVSVVSSHGHPSTDGLAECMVQTFKLSLRKNSNPTKQAVHEFLLMYRRTPGISGSSPSELLMKRNPRTKLDIYRDTTECVESTEVIEQDYKVGDQVYATFYATNQRTTWVPATIIHRLSRNLFSVKTCQENHIWKRHSNQLRKRTAEDAEPAIDFE